MAGLVKDGNVHIRGLAGQRDNKAYTLQVGFPLVVTVETVKDAPSPITSKRHRLSLDE
jgi:hypothetical protein